MIACLRFVGVFNAAVWLGASVFFTFAIGQAVSSNDLQALLGQNFSYFSPALAGLLAKRYVACQLICAAIAVGHLAAEWLYLGKYPQKLWVAWLLGLSAAALVGGYWFQPRLQRWHDVRFGRFTRPAQREAAVRAFSAWQTTTHLLNLLSIAGLTVYLWRVANPPDQTRFLSAGKFRS